MRGRTTINLTLYKAQIISWFQDDDKTLNAIATLLQSSYDITTTTKTVQRRLKDWGISKRTRVHITSTLQARIAYFFCILGFTDKEIVHALQCEGVRIEHSAVVRVRRQLGLWRRLSIFDRQGLEEQLREAIKVELDKGVIESYGKGLLYTHFRTSGFIATRYIYIFLLLLLYII
jgi:transposase